MSFPSSTTAVLEFECGFSIYPALPPTPENVQLYKTFLNRLTTTFNGRAEPSSLSADKKLLIADADPGFYSFMLSKCPKIPANPEHCNHFLDFRLGFKQGGVPGQNVAVACVKEVYVIARECFGERVKFWHGLHRMRCNKQWGYYTLFDVEQAEARVRKLYLSDSGTESTTDESCLEESGFEESGTDESGPEECVPMEMQESVIITTV